MSTYLLVHLAHLGNSQSQDTYLIDLAGRLPCMNIQAKALIKSSSNLSTGTIAIEKSQGKVLSMNIEMNAFLHLWACSFASLL